MSTTEERGVGITGVRQSSHDSPSNPNSPARTNEDKILDMEAKAERLEASVEKRQAAKQDVSQSPKGKKTKGLGDRIGDRAEGCTECCADCCVGCECVVS